MKDDFHDGYIAHRAEAGFKNVGDDGLFPNYSNKDIWINGFIEGFREAKTDDNKYNSLLLAHEKLTNVFKEVLQKMYERSPKGGTWEGTIYWNRKAGLKG